MTTADRQQVLCAIDPGWGGTGWALLSALPTRPTAAQIRAARLDSGTIKPPSSRKPWPDRLHALAEAVAAVVWRADTVILERSEQRRVYARHRRESSRENEAIMASVASNMMAYAACTVTACRIVSPEHVVTVDPLDMAKGGRVAVAGRWWPDLTKPTEHEADALLLALHYLTRNR